MRCGAIVSLVVSAAASVPHLRALGQIDAEYTRIIRQNLDDPRMTTELVDHLPASDRVPTPLAYFGRVVGTPGELTYAKDIARYYRALAAASPRARFFTIGTSEEGRAIVMLAIADEETMASLEANRGRLGALTDPRRTTDAEANRLVKSAKPVYWITGGMHSPETGGPETLIELAYRLIVEDTPFVRHIRANVITLITPVLEVDGIPICVVTASGLVFPELLGEERRRAAEEMMKPVVLADYVQMIARQLFQVGQEEAQRIGTLLRGTWKQSPQTLH